jgi:type II secretory pathway predicted ATPase ExeA
MAEGLVLKKGGYERYGLTGNPFRDLSSDSIDNVDIFHVHQKVDDTVTTIIEEVVARESKAVVAILGGLGAGKTERLLLAANLAKRENFFWVMQNMNRSANWLTKGIADGVMKYYGLGSFAKIFSAPPWYKELAKINKAGSAFDADAAGRAIAKALNSKTPSFLLLNDLHNMTSAEDREIFLKTFHTLIDNTDPGTMVMLSCDESFFNALMAKNASLSQRINRTLVVSPLEDHEASLVIAKRLLAKRLVEEMDPIYPFTEETIKALNAEAKGNPRQLMKLADLVIDLAASRKAMRVDIGLAEEVVAHERAAESAHLVQASQERGAAEGCAAPSEQPHADLGDRGSGTGAAIAKDVDAITERYKAGDLTKEEYIKLMREARAKMLKAGGGNQKSG